MKKLISFCVVAALAITSISAQAIWQCNYRNARNQLWVGTGATAPIARARAENFCRSNSVNPNTCAFMRCFWR